MHLFNWKKQNKVRNVTIHALNYYSFPYVEEDKGL